MTPQLTHTVTVTITCHGCRRRTPIDPRHLDNLTAAGPWRCDTCKAGVP